MVVGVDCPDMPKVSSRGRGRGRRQSSRSSTVASAAARPGVSALSTVSSSPPSSLPSSSMGVPMTSTVVPSSAPSSTSTDLAGFSFAQLLQAVRDQVRVEMNSVAAAAVSGTSGGPLQSSVDGSSSTLAIVPSG